MTIANKTVNQESMKKFKIILLGFLFIGMVAQAQKFYIRAGLGVTVSTSANYYNDYTYSSVTGGKFIVTSKNHGLGSGLPFVLAAGYNLSENFGFELGINYFYGFSSTQENSYTNSYDIYYFKSTWNGQMLSLVPAFVMSLPLHKFKPYARLGLKMGVLNSVVSENSMIPENAPGTSYDVIDYKIKEYGGMAIGVQTAVGSDFILNDRISLFGEIQVDGISYAPKHGKYLEYRVDGINKMYSRTVKQNQWNYVKEVDHSITIPNDQPDEHNKVNEQFGNVGIMLGVKIII